MGYLQIARQIKQWLGERGTIETPLVQQLMPVVVMEDLTLGPSLGSEPYARWISVAPAVGLRSALEIIPLPGFVTVVERITNRNAGSVFIVGLSTNQVNNPTDVLVSRDTRIPAGVPSTVQLQHLSIATDATRTNAFWQNQTTSVQLDVLNSGQTFIGPVTLVGALPDSAQPLRTLVCFGAADNAGIDVHLSVRIYPRE